MPERKGVGVKGDKGMVKDSNQTFGGNHFVVYADVEIQYCTTEIYNIIYQFYLNFKKNTYYL